MPDFNKFNNYYQNHMPEVYAYVHFRTNFQTETTEDLVSEIFMKALEHFEKFSEESGTFKSWIFKITKNHLIDHYRRQSKKETVSLDEIADFTSNNAATDLEVNNTIRVEKLKAALEEIEEEKREIIILKYLSGYSYKEISEITGKDENQIRVQAHRTLKQLKGKLYEINYNPSDE